MIRWWTNIKAMEAADAAEEQRQAEAAEREAAADQEEFELMMLAASIDAEIL